MMGVLEKSPELVCEYGQELADFYPDRVCAVFVQLIRNEAARPACRKTYQKVCESIACMGKVAKGEQICGIIESLREQYRRRQTFVDELDIVKEKMLKQMKL